MEIGAFEDGKSGRVKCLFCRRWTKLAELELKSADDLQEAPCPHCGDTGEALRQEQCEVKRALEERGYNFGS